MAGDSVGLVNPDGEMIVLNEGEVKIGCRMVEVAEMQTSTLAVLDCGQGEGPYRIGDELRLGLHVGAKWENGVLMVNRQEKPLW